MNSSQYNGNYRVSINIGSNQNFASDNVRYQRFAYGTGQGITETYAVNQQGANLGPKCVTCENGGANYDWYQGQSGGYMKMIDKSSDHPDPAGADQMTYQAV